MLFWLLFLVFLVAQEVFSRKVLLHKYGMGEVTRTFAMICLLCLFMALIHLSGMQVLDLRRGVLRAQPEGGALLFLVLTVCTAAAFLVSLAVEKGWIFKRQPAALNRPKDKPGNPLKLLLMGVGAFFLFYIVGQILQLMASRW